MEIYEEDFFLDFIHSIEQFMMLGRKPLNCLCHLIQCDISLSDHYYPLAPYERSTFLFSTLFSITDITHISL